LAASSPYNNAHIWDIKYIKNPLKSIICPSGEKTTDIDWLSHNTIGVASSKSIRVEDIAESRTLKTIAA
jgi:hypothetical protein